MAARKRKLEMTDSWREKCSTTMLMLRLKSHIDGDIELQPTQLKAIELILQRTVASLSSVEQTVHNADDTLSEDQLLAKFSALFEAQPGLLQRILALQARGATQQLTSVPSSDQLTGTDSA